MLDTKNSESENLDKSKVLPTEASLKKVNGNEKNVLSEESVQKIDPKYDEQNSQKNVFAKTNNSSNFDMTTKYVIAGICIFTFLMATFIFIYIVSLPNKKQDTNGQSNLSSFSSRSNVQRFFNPLPQDFPYDDDNFLNSSWNSSSYSSYSSSSKMPNKNNSKVLPNETFIGNINSPSNGKVILYPNSKLEGDINITNGDITIMDNAVIDGGITTQSITTISIGKNVKIKNGIDSSGQITIDDNTEIGGLLESQSGGYSIKIGNSVQVKKGLKTYTDGITIGNNFKTDGDINLPSGDGEIVIGNSAEIKGGIKNSSGNITIGNNNKIDGEIAAGGKFVQGNNNQIKLQI